MDIQKEKVKVLLFDLGNVVINVSFANVLETWSNHASVNAETLKARFVLDTFYERHERGEITSRDYFDSVKESLGIHLTHAQFEEGWNGIFLGEVSGIREVLQQARQKFPLYIFSNTNPTHWTYACQHYSELLGLFEKLFTSSELKKRKPHREAFEAVVNEIGVNAENVVFFDDLLENANGARAAGLQAVHVQSSIDTKKAIEFLLAMR